MLAVLVHGYLVFLFEMLSIVWFVLCIFFLCKFVPVQYTLMFDLRNQISVSIWYFALWAVVIFVWNALNCLDFLCGLSTLVSCSIISCLGVNQISVYVNFLVFGCLVLLLDIAMIGYFTWIVYSWFSIFFIVLLTFSWKLDG